MRSPALALPPHAAAQPGWQRRGPPRWCLRSTAHPLGRGTTRTRCEREPALKCLQGWVPRPPRAATGPSGSATTGAACAQRGRGAMCPRTEAGAHPAAPPYRAEPSTGTGWPAAGPKGHVVRCRCRQRAGGPLPTVAPCRADRLMAQHCPCPRRWPACCRREAAPSPRCAWGAAVCGSHDWRRVGVGKRTWVVPASPRAKQSMYCGGASAAWPHWPRGSSPHRAACRREGAMGSQTRCSPSSPTSARTRASLAFLARKTRSAHFLPCVCPRCARRCGALALNRRRSRACCSPWSRRATRSTSATRQPANRVQAALW